MDMDFRRQAERGCQKWGKIPGPRVVCPRTIIYGIQLTPHIIALHPIEGRISKDASDTPPVTNPSVPRRKRKSGHPSPPAAMGCMEYSFCDHCLQFISGILGRGETGVDCNTLMIPPTRAW